MVNKKGLLLLLIPFVLSSCGRSLPTTASFVLNPVSGDIHTEKQNEFINASDEQRNEMIRTMGNKSLSFPNSISFSWEENNDTKDKADNYRIYFSEDSLFSNPLIYTVDAQSAEIYNLKIKTPYFYKIESIHGDKSFFSETSTFTLNNNCPRNIFIDGVENVRDMGGWSVGEGKTFKQGMIYRTAQFNYGGSKNNYQSAPTEEGKKELLDVLKIKTEIDLRRTTASFNYDEVNGITSSPLGENVNYISTPMVFGGTNIFTNSLNTSAIVDFFNTLANENNYPIAFHCLRGTDRTGALAYALGALLGMSKEDLALDYLFSNLANIGSSVNDNALKNKNFYAYQIENTPGDNISDKAKNYLHEKCGIEFSVLNKIIDILID